MLWPAGVDKAVRFTECAFYHKRTKTLLVTDAVIYVDDKAPSVIPTKALLGIARDGWLARLVNGGRSKEEVQAIARDEKEAVEDTPQNRMLGWMRMCLLVLYFQPAGGWLDWVLCIGAHNITLPRARTSIWCTQCQCCNIFQLTSLT